MICWAIRYLQRYNMFSSSVPMPWPNCATKRKQLGSFTQKATVCHVQNRAKSSKRPSHPAIRLNVQVEWPSLKTHGLKMPQAICTWTPCRVTKAYARTHGIREKISCSPRFVKRNVAESLLPWHRQQVLLDTLQMQHHWSPGSCFASKTDKLNTE